MKNRGDFRTEHNYHINRESGFCFFAARKCVCGSRTTHFTFHTTQWVVYSSCFVFVFVVFVLFVIILLLHGILNLILWSIQQAAPTIWTSKPLFSFAFVCFFPLTKVPHRFSLFNMYCSDRPSAWDSYDSCQLWPRHTYLRAFTFFP